MWLNPARGQGLPLIRSLVAGLADPGDSGRTMSVTKVPRITLLLRDLALQPNGQGCGSWMLAETPVKTS